MMLRSAALLVAGVAAISSTNGGQIQVDVVDGGAPTAGGETDNSETVAERVEEVQAAVQEAVHDGEERAQHLFAALMTYIRGIQCPGCAGAGGDTPAVALTNAGGEGVN